jgi:UDP-N-acetylglucosamine--N-acetylmuramyl-(pentapeptide) pyrophosphoryl-undecaprenol N-acetylglucosamine transferase
MGDNPTILLAGGGTGGHLYPGISVAESMKTVWPGVKPVFLCTEREIDRTILQPTGFEFIPQPIVPPVKTISGLLRFWRSWRETKDLIKQTIRRTRPVAVLGLGGYAAGVAVKYSAERGIPTAIINPDVIPGKANQFLTRHALAVCCQFEESRQHLSAEYAGRVKITGCPIRPDIRAVATVGRTFLSATPSPEKADAARRLELRPNLLTLVITGASQGAQTVNEAVLAVLPDLKLDGWQILHLAGREHYAAVSQAYRDSSIEARVIDFTPNMADVWSVCDLAVSRAGASTCAELTACGMPSILMPYPYHKDMHQRANAKVLSDAGAAVLLDDLKDAKKNADRLRPALEPLLYDPAQRRTMGEAARHLGKPDAAERVAILLREMALARVTDKS